MKEYKDLLKISKGFIDKKHHKKIKSLKNEEEKINLLKYLIISKIKLMQIELEILLKNSKKSADFEILLLKISNISHKITLLEHNLNEKDFKKIELLIEDIKSKVI
jgi:alkyl hydroperoxide reductase subunit AhpF